MRFEDFKINGLEELYLVRGQKRVSNAVQLFDSTGCQYEFTSRSVENVSQRFTEPGACTCD